MEHEPDFKDSVMTEEIDFDDLPLDFQESLLDQQMESDFGELKSDTDYWSTKD